MSDMFIHLAKETEKYVKKYGTLEHVQTARPTFLKSSIYIYSGVGCLGALV